MSGFLHLPPGAVRLVNATVPACLLGRPGDLLRHALTIEGDRITDAPAPELDLKGAMVLPAFIDMHTHLDKGHISPRAPNPDGTFAGALATVAADRTANWS
ncbi:MAG TPA: amidohydrolase family protein, partial [Paracoccaceae bacterium]|nr:amidohydrolase family protein [Paracoccaceae bacterium]